MIRAFRVLRDCRKARLIWLLFPVSFRFRGIGGLLDLPRLATVA